MQRQGLRQRVGVNVTAWVLQRHDIQ